MAPNALASLKSDLYERRARSQASKSSGSKAKYDDLDNFKRPSKLPDNLRHRAPSSYMYPEQVAANQRKRPRKASEGPLPDPTLPIPSNQEAARQAALKRKVRAYDALKRGMYAGVSDDQLHSGSIDWETKVAAEATDSDSDSPQRSRHSSPSDTPTEEEEELITYTDEFGRTRTQPASQVPRSVLAVVAPRPKSPDLQEAIHYGPATNFPVYQPTEAEAQVRAQKKLEASKPVQQARFDSRAEIRQRGAGFFRFSHDEAERQDEMRTLAAERQHTVLERKRRGKTSELDSGIENIQSDVTSKITTTKLDDDDDEDDDDPFARVERKRKAQPAASSHEEILASRRAQIAARRAELQRTFKRSSAETAVENKRRPNRDQPDRDVEVDAFLADILDRPPT